MSIAVANPHSEPFLLDIETGERIEADPRVIKAVSDGLMARGELVRERAQLRADVANLKMLVRRILSEGGTADVREMIREFGVEVGDGPTT